MTKNLNNQGHADVVIVGAGLGGLATAALLGRAGRRVIVCERSPVAGGRGRTIHRNGFQLNLGPHALYCAGPGAELLRRLDIHPRGRAPDGHGVILRAGREHATPASPLTMLSTSALELRSKFELLRFFTRIGRLPSAGLERVGMDEWLAREIVADDLRPLIAALVRISTFCDELDTLSAEAGVLQMQLALRGVLYLDGGWQQLVDALVERCLAAGVELRLDARVDAVGRSDEARWAVELDGRTLTCDDLVVAGSPSLADALLGPVLGGPRFAAGVRPLRLAALDLGIRGAWPGPGAAFDFDDPIYLSVFSNFVDVAPAQHSLISVAWYRRDRDDELAPAELRARLERHVRRWLPNLDEVLVTEQFLPDMTVAHDRPEPSRGGLAGRAPAVLGGGLHLVGDWVGERGHLLEASLASAEAVASAVLGAARGSWSAEPRPAFAR